MITVYHILRSNSFFLGADGNRYPMFIGTADKDYIFFFKSQVADVNVSRHIYPCEVSDMDRPVGIGQCRCYGSTFEFLFHIYSMYLFCYERF